MANVVHKGSPMKTSGDLPKVGSKAPDFLLTTGDLKDVKLADFAGKKKVLNIAHSLDTGTCAAAARRFNQEASKLGNAVVLTISNDLPFAQKRFCEAEGIKNVTTLSQMRNRDFGRDYGVALVEGSSRACSPGRSSSWTSRTRSSTPSWFRRRARSRTTTRP